MSVIELLSAIEAAGGVLTLAETDDAINCQHIPRELAVELRGHRAEVLAILKQRAASVSQWILSGCVLSSRCASNPKILYRECGHWAKANRAHTGTYADFLRELEGWGFTLDDSGMVMGLVLAEDFLQAWQYQREGSTADRYMQ